MTSRPQPEQDRTEALPHSHSDHREALGGLVASLLLAEEERSTELRKLAARAEHSGDYRRHDERLADVNESRADDLDRLLEAARRLLELLAATLPEDEEMVSERAAPAAVSIDPSAWQPAGGDVDPEAQLHTTLVINGLGHHLEAVAVQVVDDRQVPAEGARYSADDFDAIYGAAGAQAPFQAVELRGRSYVLIATPYS